MLCQCPKCETIFRLGREHLDYADGQVSCSICQFEFDAYESLVPEASDRTSPTPSEQAGSILSDDNIPIADHVPIIIIDDDDDDDMSVMFSASLEEPQHVIELVPPEPTAEAAPEAKADTDTNTMVEVNPEPEPEPEPEADTVAVAEPEQAQQEIPIPEYMKPASPQELPEQLGPASPQGLPEQLESELMEAGLRDAAIATHRVRRLLWNTGAVLLILTLGLQYVYVIRNELAQSETYRPWVESYCQAIGCTLPLRRELQSIELLQREIAQHPTQHDVLSVRAMFVNQAHFKQAWPVVKITLSDTNNQVIAERQLQPEEYLAEQSIKQGMIPGRQMTLDLQFIKPDKPVSTYEFDFL